MQMCAKVNELGTLFATHFCLIKRRPYASFLVRVCSVDVHAQRGTEHLGFRSRMKFRTEAHEGTGRSRRRASICSSR